MTTQTRIAAEEYLEALSAHGIEYLFANPGTDFAPIVEAFARAARTNRPVPRPIVRNSGPLGSSRRPAPSR